MSKFLNYSQFNTGYGKGGAKPGHHDIETTELSEARSYTQLKMEKHNRNIDIELPNFDENYKKLRYIVSHAHTKRNEMPVFDTDTIKALQKTLVKGRIDIEPPYAPSTMPDNLFPTGLTPAQAAEFLKRGLQDGNLTDDIINVRLEKVKASSMIPIQKQIYLSKCIKRIAKLGASERIEWIKNTLFVTSGDFHIIDGHHRYATAMLIDPSTELHCIVIDLPIKKLLDLSVAFTDMMGKKRNA